MRQCKVCKVEKEGSEFYKRKCGAPRHQCKECHNKYTMNRYNKDKSIHQRASHKCKLKQYGLTPEDYDSILENQDSSCAICCTTTPTSGRRVAKYFSVDHCHTTGKVRGLLCHNCNAGLGHLKDSKNLLRRAIGYLDRRH